jgi:hypothetical protein
MNGQTHALIDFCYQPTGIGCIVTSPLQYWSSNLTALREDPDPKETAQCIPPPDVTGRTCFDQIGTPVMQDAIFGKLTCETTSSTAPCSPCVVDAAGMQNSYLLNNNDYSNMAAAKWELDVFMRNIKSFNLLTGYHTEIGDGNTYNETLANTI